ncbi:MAG: dehydrogenase [Verrucomicrobia bacterium]|nr:dehydrogenase [Verrucomicrobiota bacterium]
MIMSRVSRWLFVATALLAGFAPATPLLAQLGDRPGGDPQRPPSPDIEIPPAPVLSPAEALRSFSLPPGFRIEMVAAEPLVHDPVMMVFDPRGRLWVAELSAYNITEIITKLPVYLDPGKPPPTRPVGRVVMLEDTDGDGRMDRRTVYWDNMDVPRAIAFVGDQVLIGDPPNLWLTRDRNGDAVMDEKTSLDDDYGTQSNVEGSPNGLLWGHDNWLYNASYKWRWRPDATGPWRREPVPAVGQWGITQDDFGRRFYTSNSDQLRGDFLPSHYAGGLDPRLSLYGIRFQVATDQSTWPVRPTPGVNRGYTKDQLRDDGRLNTFSAASASLIYRGANFPAAFEGNAFVPAPEGNLVKRNLLLEAEGRLTAINAYLNTEFLSSTDERFRPVYLANAPDGALYVVDYYRGMLEGYEFITTFLRDQILQRGLNRPLWGLGRIYRVVYEGGPRAKTPDFVRADSAALIKLLTHENGWTRDTAHRRIVDSGSPAHVPALRDLLARAPKPRDRLSALWCLEGLQSLTPADAERALTDPDSRVRAAAVQAATPLLRNPSGAKLLALMKARAGSEEPMVLAHLALSIAGTEDPVARELLWSLLPRAPEHPSLADGVLIALRGHELEVLQRLQTRIVADRGLTFGVHGLLESLATHLVVAGGASSEALVAAISDKRLPQLCRIALMRGATKSRGAILPEKALAQLATAAPDGWVRRKAAEGAAAIAQRRASRANRPPTQPLTPLQQALFDTGKVTYGLCAACHQPDGLGRSDLAPSFKEGRWSNAVSPEAAIRIVLNGKQGTPGFAAPMVGLAGLTDEQVAGVLTFVRRSFGNDASAVDPDAVERIRRRVSSKRANPWTDAELAASTGETP